MASMSPELTAKLQSNLNTTFNLIVRLKDDPDTRVAVVQSRGFTVRHTYSLISAIAIQGKASAALRLASESWVVSIEEDKQVHTM